MNLNRLVGNPGSTHETFGVSQQGGCEPDENAEGGDRLGENQPPPELANQFRCGIVQTARPLIRRNSEFSLAYIQSLSFQSLDDHQQQKREQKKIEIDR